jgi:DNA-binding CsgD family transcriptional regulator
MERRSALLERAGELARLSAQVDATAAGEFGLVVIEGRAGAGKSAILRALATEAEGRGVRVLRASGLELEREYPFGVVRQLFVPALHELGPAVRREVFAGAAELAEKLLARAETEGPRLADPAFALLHSLYWATVGLTDLAPLALVVDDVQWADPLSLRFLAFALRRSEGLRLLIALARRELSPEEEPDALAAVLRGPALVMRPAPLSSVAIGVILAQAVGHPLEAAVIGEAARLTEGNPLYVRELADLLSSAGAAGREDALGILRAAAPAAVGRRVRTALARLSANSQAVARAAAVLGDEVPLQRAAELATVDPDSASAAADSLVDADILVVGEPLRFRHPLVREAVLKSMEPRARARAHARAAKMLIAHGDAPERAALHLLESDPSGDTEAVTTLRVAAKRFSATAASDLAIRALRRAVLEPPDHLELPLVLNDLGGVEFAVGDEQAFEHLEAAFSSGHSLEALADGAFAYAWLLITQGREQEAEALITRVLGAISDRERRLLLVAELLSTAWEMPAARERLTSVTAGLTGESPAERLLLGLQAYGAAYEGEMSAAEAAPLMISAFGNGFLLAELGPDSPTYVRLLVGLNLADELDYNSTELSAAIAEGRRRGATFGLAFATMLRGVIAWRRGQLAVAEADARVGLEIMTQLGWLAGFPYPLSLLVDVLNDAGELDEADRLLEENNLSGSLPGGRAFFVEFLGTRGRLRLAQGRTEQGIADLVEQAVQLDELGHSRPDVRGRLAKSLVPALVRAGRVQEGRQIAEKALQVARAYGVPRYVADSLRGRALAHPRGPDLKELEEVATIYDRLGARHDLAATLLDIGAALRRKRKPAAARAPLRRALDLARASGARPIAERAEHELRAAGARPRRDRITGRDALTASERRVAELASGDMTNRQIGETLFITRRTVESHLEHVFRKLDIHSRSDLQRAISLQDEEVAPIA